MPLKKIFADKDELKVAESSEIGSRQNSLEANYFKKIYEKPWGYEFLAYQNKNVGIWILTINKDQKTSLHCHYKKSSIVICLDGVAKIDLYNGFEILRVGESLYADKKTFHGLGSYTDTCVLMEIEIYTDNVTFTDKDDLLRIKDMYCREKTGYGASVKEVDVTGEVLQKYRHFKIEENCNVNIGETKINVVNNIDNIPNLHSKIVFLLEGRVQAGAQMHYNGSFIENFNDLVYFSNKNNFLIIENNFIDENKKIIFNNNQLKDFIDTHKPKNIGLTSGCFDILHTGHLNFFRNCKQYCDILMVCLSSDEQISTLKGSNRPVNYLEDRINILKCISDIDYIVLYNESNSKIEKDLDDIINIVSPLYWFKGSDYSENSIREKHPSLKQIKIFENVTGKSTTNLITKIVNS
jgi:rfaE bifunctional protein nucleotidyltransferase chain/domain